jgi:RHS repeat-associated protein
VSLKRYRYTGKERDEETGLYYHGARYYASWLGRWTTSDPQGLTDGTNTYSYVHDSPVTFVDLNGNYAISPEQSRERIENLPNNRATFLNVVNDIAKHEVNLPSIFESFLSKNPEYDQKIEYKPIDEVATINFFDHFQKIKNSLNTAKGREPAWMKDLVTQLAQPGSASMDWHLALAIALREGGPGMYSSSEEKVSTARNAGLDNTFKNRKALITQGLIPSDWTKSMSEDPEWPGAAMVPRTRLLALTFASVGRAQSTLTEKIGEVYFSEVKNADERTKMANELVNSLTPLERRIWIANSFGGVGYLTTMLDSFHQAGLSLGAITNIPDAIKGISAVSKKQKEAIQKLERFTDIKRSKKLNVATKTAIVAEAYERFSESRAETDQRTYPFLF